MKNNNRSGINNGEENESERKRKYQNMKNNSE